MPWFGPTPYWDKGTHEKTQPAPSPCEFGPFLLGVLDAYSAICWRKHSSAPTLGSKNSGHPVCSQRMKLHSSSVASGKNSLTRSCPVIIFSVLALNHRRYLIVEKETLTFTSKKTTVGRRRIHGKMRLFYSPPEFSLRASTAIIHASHAIAQIVAVMSHAT